jgi:hypothetical protein
MKRPICLSFAAAILLLSTIGNAQPPLYKNLPPAANHIYSIRLGQIVTKGDLLTLLNSLPPSKDPKAGMVINFLKDPSSTGVDISHEILIAQITAAGTGADTVSYTQVLVPITDSAKFRKTLAGAMKDLHIHRLPGKGNTTYKDKMAMAWNDQLLVITLGSAESSGSSISDSATVFANPGKKPIAAPVHKAPPAVHRSVGELSLEKSLAALAGFPANPLLTDQRFVSGFAGDEDVHSWSTRMDIMQTIAKLGKKFAAKSFAMQGKSFPDYSNLSQMPHPPVLSTFNFADGRIVFHMTTFNKPEDGPIYQKMFDRPINKDMLARIPNAGLLLGVAAMHINPSAIPDAMERYHTRQMVDSMLGKKGLTISDVSAIFGGDILVAVMGDTTAASDTSKKRINIYFVATLGDPAKMMQVAAKLAGSTDAADTAQMAKMKKLTEKMVIRDNTLVISGSQEMAKKYFDNTDRRSTSLIADNSAQDFVIDLKTVSAYMSTTMTGNPKVMVATRVFERLDKVELRTSLPDGNNTNMTFQIVTGDPSTNSLKYLLSLLH